MIGGHHVLEEVATLHHDMLGFRLECLDPRGLFWPTQCGLVSLPKESGEGVQGLL